MVTVMIQSDFKMKKAIFFFLKRYNIMGNKMYKNNSKQSKLSTEDPKLFGF